MGRVARTLTDRGERHRRPNEIAVPRLVRVLGYERPHVAGSRHDLGEIDEVIIGRGEIDVVERSGRTLSLAVADSRMSQRHARLVRDKGWTVEDLDSRNGAFLDGVRVTKAALEAGMWIELGRTAFLFCTARAHGPEDVDASELEAPFGEIRTFSASFEAALAGLARIALTKQNVIVHGETGSGKELLARGLHAASRRGGPFVAVNCGAITPTLVESELFGYRKGAFSGALEDRTGLVRSADEGTLFLDEIGDLPLAAQAKLLRVIQQREVMPVGATRPIEVDVRVVAATHRDLEREVEAGRFREDLYARLAGFVLSAPPLRERREDLGLLIAALLARVSHSGESLRLSREAARALLRYAWPRNVRELEQVLGSACALANEGIIELEHLPAALDESASENLSAEDAQRRDELRELLAKHTGNVAAVGRALGVARTQVHRWMKRFGLDAHAFRSDD